MKIKQNLKKPKGKIALIVVILAIFVLSNSDISNQSTIQSTYTGSELLEDYSVCTIWEDSCCPDESFAPNDRQCCSGESKKATVKTVSGGLGSIVDFLGWISGGYFSSDSLSYDGKICLESCDDGFISQFGGFVRGMGVPIDDCNLAGFAGIGIGILALVLILSVI